MKKLLAILLSCAMMTASLVSCSKDDDDDDSSSRKTTTKNKTTTSATKDNDDDDEEETSKSKKPSKPAATEDDEDDEEDSGLVGKWEFCEAMGMSADEFYEAFDEELSYLGLELKADGTGIMIFCYDNDGDEEAAAQEFEWESTGKNSGTYSNGTEIDKLKLSGGKLILGEGEEQMKFKRIKKFPIDVDSLDSNYITKSKIASCNSAASSIQKGFEASLVDADAYGYKMKGTGWVHFEDGEIIDNDELSDIVLDGVKNYFYHFDKYKGGAYIYGTSCIAVYIVSDNGYLGTYPGGYVEVDDFKRDGVFNNDTGWKKGRCSEIEERMCGKHGFEGEPEVTPDDYS